MDPMGQWYMNFACILDIPLYFLELKGVFFNPSNLMICKGKKHRFVLYFSSVSSSKQPFFCKICVTWMISPNHDLKKKLLRNHQNFENQFIRNFLNLLEKTRTQFRCDHPRFFHPMRHAGFPNCQGRHAPPPEPLKLPPPATAGKAVQPGLARLLRVPPRHHPNHDQTPRKPEIFDGDVSDVLLNVKDYSENNDNMIFKNIRDDNFMII